MSARIVFFGTPDFALPTLNALIASDYDVLSVVTQPDRPRGRRHILTPSPVKETAAAADLAIWQPERARDAAFIAEMRSVQPDLFVTAAYGQILSQELLDVPRYGALNVHASLLPRWRGASPVNACLIAGDTVSGVTIMRMDAGLDTGDILTQTSVELADTITAGELFDQLALLGAELLLSTLPDWLDGKIVPQPQDDTLATYAPRLTRDDGEIDWSLPAIQIHNAIRGLTPWPGGWTTLDGKIVKVHQAAVSDYEADGLKPGTIVRCGETIDVACGTGVLSLHNIQFASGRAMCCAECSHNMRNGMRFGR